MGFAALCGFAVGSSVIPPPLGERALHLVLASILRWDYGCLPKGVGVGVGMLSD